MCGQWLKKGVSEILADENLKKILEKGEIGGKFSTESEIFFRK